MAAVPNDVMDGEPMRYRKERSDSYLLYSVGWNLRDDGGVTASSGKGAINVMEGDWVWRLRGGQKTATVDE
jgi:hypothetical protein